MRVFTHVANGIAIFYKLMKICRKSMENGHPNHVYTYSCDIKGRSLQSMYTLDLSPSRAELHIGQCISSNHPCLLPCREHLPTSIPILAGRHAWSLASFPRSWSSPFPPRAQLSMYS